MIEESPNWNHILSFRELCSTIRFAYIFTSDGKLAGGDYQYPHLVSEQNERGLVFTTVKSTDAGIEYRSDGVSGHGIMAEVTKTFDIQIYLNPEECVAEYLKLLEQERAEIHFN